MWDSPKKTRNTNLQIGTLFSPERKGDTLTKLRPNIVFVGLNISQALENGEWTNIHEDKDLPNAQFRYALWETVFWGAYFTDFIKGYEEGNSRIVRQYFSNPDNKEKLNAHRDNFIAEMLKLTKIMKNDFPLVIVLLGEVAKHLFTLSKCEGCLRKEFEKMYVYNRDHFAKYNSPEKYRAHILELQQLVIRDLQMGDR